jgi:hypothetical protein
VPKVGKPQEWTVTDKRAFSTNNERGRNMPAWKLTIQPGERCLETEATAKDAKQLALVRNIVRDCSPFLDGIFETSEFWAKELK